ncbi:hypothetical protein MLD52_21655 [Puniceicoccaceae bacterium K14]|nr:hypothetical protein [Puniceicoccaceae bacterium K14]
MNKNWSLGSENNKKSMKWSLIGYIGVSPIAIYLGMTDFGKKPFEPRESWLFLVPIVVILCIAFFVKKAASADEKSRIEIDYDEGLAVFRNYRFITKFAGNKRLEIARIPFAGIFKTKITRNKGNVFLDLKTEQGLVTIVGYSEIQEIIETFQEIVTQNEKTNHGFSQKMAEAPKPTTPWYGWLLLLVAVGVIAFISWSYLKTT